MNSASQAKAASNTTTGLVVSVAYAENIGDIAGVNAWFPTPWCTLTSTTSTTCATGADPAKVRFIGQPDPNTTECQGSSNPTLTKPYCWDEGGVRLDNPTAQAVTVSGIAVNVRCNTSSGKLYYGGSVSPTGFGCASGRTQQLWAGSGCSGCFFPLVIQPGASVILTGNPPAPAGQASFVNFDTSDAPHGSCTPAAAPPTVTIVSSNGGSPVTDTLTDTAHVLDTGWWVKGAFGGVDSGWCPKHQNESVAWEQIGWPGRGSITCPGTCTPPGLANGLALNPSAPPTQSPGGSIAETATLTGGDGVPLANAPVTITVTSGPDVNQHTSGLFTDSNGNVSMNLTNNGTAGADTLVATAGFIGPFSSNTACVVFGSGTCGTPPPPNDFSISASPNSVTVTQGNGTSTTIQTAVTSGSAQSVSLSTTGSLPAGVSAGFSPSSVTAGANSTMTITTTTSTPTGSFPITVTGTGTSATHSTTVTLNVSSTAPPPGCGSPWTCADVGGPTLAGSASFSGGVWTIQGAGADIHASADQFQFVSQPLAGDGTIIAHVTSQTNTNAWAKTGLMVRADSSAGAACFTILATPGNGVILQDRLTSGGANNRITSTNMMVLPQWLKITRAGTTFTAFTSPNGTAWTQMGSPVSIPALSGSILEGMAVTSHNTGALSTVTMDNVTTS